MNLSRRTGLRTRPPRLAAPSGTGLRTPIVVTGLGTSPGRIGDPSHGMWAANVVPALRTPVHGCNCARRRTRLATDQAGPVAFWHRPPRPDSPCTVDLRARIRFSVSSVPLCFMPGAEESQTQRESTANPTTLMLPMASCPAPDGGLRIGGSRSRRRLRREPRGHDALLQQADVRREHATRSVLAHREIAQFQQRRT